MKGKSMLGSERFRTKIQNDERILRSQGLTRLVNILSIYTFTLLLRNNPERNHKLNSSIKFIRTHKWVYRIISSDDQPVINVRIIVTPLSSRCKLLFTIRHVSMMFAEWRGANINFRCPRTARRRQIEHVGRTVARCGTNDVLQYKYRTRPN